jgi:hypothetical protein
MPPAWQEVLIGLDQPACGKKAGGRGRGRSTCEWAMGQFRIASYSLSMNGRFWRAQSGHSKHRLRPVRDVLRDRNDLKLLTGCTCYIPNSFAHQQPCHWGYEGN